MRTEVTRWMILALYALTAFALLRWALSVVP